jgi:hypothetical protein
MIFCDGVDYDIFRGFCDNCYRIQRDEIKETQLLFGLLPTVFIL